jgi:hypothetical protein
MTTGWIVQYRHIRYKHAYDVPWTELVETPTREQALGILHQLEKIALDYQWTLLEHRNGDRLIIVKECKCYIKRF